MSFTTIKNGVDERLTIIRHDESGFYNITKTAKLVHSLKLEDQTDTVMGSPTAVDEAARNSVQPRGPQTSHWFANRATTQLFEALASLGDYEVHELRMEVSTGKNEYRGTYVHPKLYDHFVAWIDPKYALLISIILEKFHSDANRMIIQEKEDAITSLKRDLADRDEKYKKELAEQNRIRDEELKDTLKRFQEEANKQRAEILQETKAAREDISDLHGTVIEQHSAMLEIAEHTSVEVASSKKQYFAMTSYRERADENNTLHFKIWRCQAKRMIPELIKVMSDVPEDSERTAHQLVIPPIYCPGSVNIGNAGKASMELFIKECVAKINKRRKKNKITIRDFKEEIGVVTSSVNPSWTPNNHLYHGMFVDFYLNEIKKVKVVKLSVSDPKLQAQLDAQVSKRYQSLINATGESRERLMEIIEKARDAMATPTSSDEE